MKYILFIPLVFLFSFMHPFYLGVADLKYSASQRSLQCAVKLFTNDLEAALNKVNKTKVDLINYKDTSATAKLLNDYITKRFHLKLNGQPRSFEFIGFEREEEATWMYLEYNNCEIPKKIEVSNSLLFDYLKNQTNIVHAEVNGTKKSAKASNPWTNFIFDFL